MAAVGRCGTCGLEYSGATCPQCAPDSAQAPTRIAAPEEALPLRPGEKFHGLEITRLLGKGGMGIVYEALQPSLRRAVALKILPRKLAEDPEFQIRFQREAQALAALSHPNIVAIYDFGADSNLFFLVMELVDGVNLRHLLRGMKLPSDEALQIIPQLCDALAYAHSEGVIHRDIKPENILIDRKGRVKIADFGLAKLSSSVPEASTLTATNVAMGTPRYMAPEQFVSSKMVDHRADIYSLGVVFYEMLTGELPMGHFELPSKKVQVDVRMDTIILKALEQEPERRYQSAAEIRTDVDQVTTGRSHQSLLPSPPRSARRSVGILIAAAVGLCLLGILALVSRLSSEMPPPREGAVALTQRGGPVRAASPVVPSDSKPPLPSPNDPPEAVRLKESAEDFVRKNKHREAALLIGKLLSEYPTSQAAQTASYPLLIETLPLGVKVILESDGTSLGTTAEGASILLRLKPADAYPLRFEKEGYSTVRRVLTDKTWGKVIIEMVQKVPLWSLSLGTGSPAVDPVLFEDILVFTGGKRLYAVDTTKRRLFWIEALEGEITGLTASPALGILVSTSRGEVLRLNSQAEKRVLWRAPLGTSPLTPSTLSSDGQTVYVGSIAGTLYAVNSATGELLWSRALPGGLLREPAIGDKVVIVGCADGTLLALGGAKKEEERWTLRLDTAPGPLLLSQGRLYVPEGLSISSIDVKTGTRAWRRTLTSQVSGRLAHMGETLCAAMKDGSVLGLSSSQGEVEWKIETGASPQVLGSTTRTSQLLVASGGRLLGISLTPVPRTAWTFSYSGVTAARGIMGKDRIFAIIGDQLHALNTD